MLKKNNSKGFLVAVDGPNGVGKTTLIETIATELIAQDYNVYVTREPSKTDLGNYLRRYAECNAGISLACMVAADRYAHLQNEIIPALNNGKIVITDRYLLSSLILQAMDGVSTEFIMRVNSEIIAPDLQLAVFAAQETLQKRLSERTELTRFEEGFQSNSELLFMKKGLEVLKSEGIDILSIDNDSDLNGNVQTIVSYILGRCFHEKVLSS